MRFNSKAYDKVFPHVDVSEHVESMVENFKDDESNEEFSKLNEEGMNGNAGSCEFDSEQ